MYRLPATPISYRAQKALEAAAREKGITPAAYCLEAVLDRLAKSGHYQVPGPAVKVDQPRPRARYRHV